MTALMERVTFGLLGPLEAIRDGERLPLGARKARAVLALLLLHANDAVAPDRLIEDLWAGRPPPSAATAVQNYISHLRKVLDPQRRRGDPLELLSTEPAGYRLCVRPGQIDAERFDGLVRDGMEALVGGRAEEAASLLREALALWRGAPLADFTYEPWAQGAVGRLEEARLSALEGRIEADLVLARHGQLVGELESLTVEFPLRERLRGQLMLALYRSGRQAEALDVFIETRRKLVEEIGLEPGPELQRLHVAILNHESALAMPTRPAAPSANLPAAPTPLIGREHELAALKEKFGRPDVRLLTLTGTGGTGKTRLALALAGAVLPRFRDGVFFVDLASVTDPSLVPSSVMQALEVKEKPGERLTDVLTAHLRDRRLLLILDNFEQVLDAAPRIAELLAACPGLKLIATSRAALHLSAEHEYPVPPLRVPDPTALPEFGALLRYESVALFVTRAQAVRPDIRLTPENARAIAEICTALDGLPLAIELAAARSKVLAPAALLRRLDHRLEVLTGGARDRPARHQTLVRAIDWSHSLLAGGEQRLFARLAVFSGGFDLESANAVCGLGGEPGLDVLEGLTSLVDNSLLRPPQTYGDEPRFRMFETIREYAWRRLHARGEHDTARRAHADWYADLAEEADRHLTPGPDQTVWTARLAREHDNVRAALAWASQAGEPELGLRLATAVSRSWQLRGHVHEARNRLADAMRRAPDAEPALRARALSSALTLARIEGDHSSGRALLEEALGAHRAAADHKEIGRTLSHLGAVAISAGEFERAEDLLQQGLDLLREVGDGAELAGALDNLADLALNTGDFARAADVSQEALVLYRQSGFEGDLTLTLLNAGLAAMHEGRDEDARTHLREALAGAKAFGDLDNIVYGLDALAALGVSRGRCEDAASVLGTAEVLAREIGMTMTPFEHLVHVRTVEALGEALGAERLAQARAAGAPLDVEAAVHRALQL